MIPIGDDNRGRTRPQLIVFALILVNVGVFIYQLMLAGQGGQELERFIYAWGARPFELSHAEDIPPLIPYPVWVTVFSSMFMHGGWLHIGGNMLYLWIFGDNVEDAMGHVRFLIFYLLSGIGAAIGQTLIDTSSLTPMVGASGAIAGVLAAYLVLFPQGRVRVLLFLGFFVTVFMLPALVVIGFWIILQFASGYAAFAPDTAQSDGVAYWAHIGGFVAGLALVFLFRDDRRLARIRAARQYGYRQRLRDA